MRRNRLTTDHIYIIIEHRNGLLREKTIIFVAGI